MKMTNTVVITQNQNKTKPNKHNCFNLNKQTNQHTNQKEIISIGHFTTDTRQHGYEFDIILTKYHEWEAEQKGKGRRSTS